MTEEQIRQNALAYADSHRGAIIYASDSPFMYDAFIAGAHSRNKEIEELKCIINEQDGIICSLDCEDRVSIIKQRDKLIEENEQLRNPWISVTDELPIEGQDILISHWNENVTRIDRVSTGDINYMKEHPDLIKYWMLTPKLIK
jgi:hypothetical protein